MNATLRTFALTILAILPALPATALVPDQLKYSIPATATVLADNASTLKVRDNLPLGKPPARYLRVKVIWAPEPPVSPINPC